MPKIQQSLLNSLQTIFENMKSWKEIAAAAGVSLRTAHRLSADLKKIIQLTDQRERIGLVNDQQAEILTAHIKAKSIKTRAKKYNKRHKLPPP